MLLPCPLFKSARHLLSVGITVIGRDVPFRRHTGKDFVVTAEQHSTRLGEDGKTQPAASRPPWHLNLTFLVKTKPAFYTFARVCRTAESLRRTLS